MFTNKSHLTESHQRIVDTILYVLGFIALILVWLTA